MKRLQGEHVLHASEIALRKLTLTGKRVAVIGGGQSGADIFLNALRGHWGQPAQLNWVSRRRNFQPLDEAAFTDEYFTPDYVDTFCGLNTTIRQQESAAQKLASDGITNETLQTIYRELYQHFDVREEEKWVRLLPHRTLMDAKKQQTMSESSYRLTCKNALCDAVETMEADIVILATGFQTASLNTINSLQSFLNLDDHGAMRLSSDFIVDSQLPAKNRIYAVNTGLNRHGIAEPQLSLMAWRAATIINHLAKDTLFDLSTEDGLIDWVTLDKQLEAVA